MVGASFFVVSLSASKYLSLSRLFVLFRVGRDGLFYLMNESRSCTVPIGPLAANSILSPPQVKKPSVQAEQRHSVSRLECLVVSARFRNFAQAVWSPRGHFPSWPIEFIETIRVAGAEKQKSEIKLDLFYFEEKPVTDLTGLRTCSNPRCCLRTYALLSFFSLSLSLSIVKLNISSCCFSPFRFLIGITASLARS